MTQESMNDLEQLLVEHEIRFLKNLEIVLSGFIHDLNNPIAVVSGQSSILKTLIEMKKSTEEKSLNSATKILSATQKMGDIIQSLRKFYKPPLNEADQVNLKTSLETIFHLAHAKVFRNELNVSAELLQDDFWTKIDSIELNLILWNIQFFLLDLLAVNPSGIFAISNQQKNDEVSLSFTLNGISLPETAFQSSELRLAKYLTLKNKGQFIANSTEIAVKLFK